MLKLIDECLSEVRCGRILDVVGDAAGASTMRPPHEGGSHRGVMTMTHTLNPDSRSRDRHRRCRAAADTRRRAHRRSRPRPLGRRCRRRDAARASTATWCWCAASTPRASRCSGRASSASGRRARARRPTQIGTARAFRADDFVFPSYREIGVNYVRGAQARRLRPRVARRGALHLQPVRHQHRDAADHHRRAGAARRRLRDGHPARRHRPGRGGVLRRRRLQPG